MVNVLTILLIKKRTTIHIPRSVLAVSIYAVLPEHCTKGQIALVEPRFLFLTGSMVRLAIRIHLLDDSMNHFLIGGTVVICRFTNNVI